MKFRVLSYPLTSDAAVWPGNLPAAYTQPFSSIRQGDRSNRTILHLFSHSGSHIDAPKHFNDAGASAHELPIENYIFFAPLVLEVPLPDGGSITPADLEPYADQLEQADIALLRTGWSLQRFRDPRRYAQAGPYLEPAGAEFLLEFEQLRAVGIDAVSIGAPTHLAESVATHQILTGVGREDERFLLILEDFKIDIDLSNTSRIYAWPLMIEEADGSPCTIVAEFA